MWTFCLFCHPSSLLHIKLFIYQPATGTTISTSYIWHNVYSLFGFSGQFLPDTSAKLELEHYAVASCAAALPHFIGNLSARRLHTEETNTICYHGRGLTGRHLPHLLRKRGQSTLRPAHNSSPISSSRHEPEENFLRPTDGNCGSWQSLGHSGGN